MSLIPFFLQSLKYPRLDGFNPEDPAQLQAAVVWLENTKASCRLPPVRSPALRASRGSSPSSPFLPLFVSVAAGAAVPD